MNVLEELHNARKVAVPIVAITTSDQPALARAIATNYTITLKDKWEGPVIEWDLVRGAIGRNQMGSQLLTKIFGQSVEDLTPNFTQFMGPFQDTTFLKGSDDKSPSKTIIICHNVQRLFDSDRAASVIQCIINARDALKQQLCCLVLLSSSFAPPAELAQDIYTLDEPLPSRQEIEKIVDNAINIVKPTPTPSAEDRKETVEALAGLASFPAEQAAYISLSTGTLRQDVAWQRKIQGINATKGLKVRPYGEYDDYAFLKGQDHIQTYLKRFAAGPAGFNVVLFIDEIDKSVASQSGKGAQDSSGVSQDFLGVTLQTMEDNKWGGLLLAGPPGTGKSQFAKSTGKMARSLTIQGDMGAAKGSYVGESEKAIRQMYKVVNEVGQSKVLVLATCNRLDNFTPELRRRFRQGVWYFDLPTSEQQSPMWVQFAQRYNLTEQQLPDTSGWTGAEIEMCCYTAWSLNIPIMEAADSIVPVALSQREYIDSLRQQAHQRYNSVSTLGKYQYNASIDTRTPIGNDGGRAIQLDNPSQPPEIGLSGNDKTGSN